MQRFPVSPATGIFTGVGTSTIVALAAPAPPAATEISVVVNDYIFDVLGSVSYFVYWDNAEKTPLTPTVTNKSQGGTIPNNWPGKDANGDDLGGDLKIQIISGTGSVRVMLKYFKRLRNSRGDITTTRRDGVTS